MDNGLSLAAFVVSIISIITTIILAIIQIHTNKKLSNNQKIINEIYQILYVEFPKLVSQIIDMDGINKVAIRNTKSFLCTKVKPLFNFLRFRKEEKYQEIRRLLEEIENNIGYMFKKNISPIEKRENLKSSLKIFYKYVDKTFDFS